MGNEIKQIAMKIIKMKNYNLTAIALLTAGVGLFSCTPKKNEGQRPNILFIMPDDHTRQAISAYGHNLNETPHIDRLAREGAIFTKACVTNSLCAPSRAVLLTGKHSFVNGQVDNGKEKGTPRFSWDQEIFPKLMQANGYQTALIGKIHLDGIPQGFDYSMVLPGQGAYYNPDFIIDGDTIRKEGYCSELITEATLDWLKNKRDPNKPFCLLYQQKAPHEAWEPAPKYLTLYDDVTFEPPVNFFDNYEGRGTAAREQAMEIDGHLRWSSLKFLVDPKGDTTGFINSYRRMNEEQRARWMAAYEPKNNKFLANMPEGKELGLWKFNRYIKDYLRTINSLDDGVGEVLDYLKKADLVENTIVIYTSDQGFNLGEHGWYDKRFMYEESFRIPLLIRYPKEIKPGTEIDKLVQNLDFAPTFLDYAGIQIPEGMQGESFRKLVSGETNEWRDAVYYTFYEYPGSNSVKRHYGVATDRYKLMHFYYDIDEWEMYDLKTDTMEMKNIYDDPAYVDVRKMLHQRLEELREFYGDSDELNDYYLKEYLKRYVKVFQN
jgi:arylsulfatase A-like enzyme